MADNNDYLPIYTELSPFHHKRDVVIMRDENIVEPNVISSIVTGIDNYVAENCKDITILNSSGCVVYPDVVGATIINSSGVIADTSGVIYISNVEVSDYSFTDDSNSHKVVLSDYTIQEKDKCIVFGISGITVSIPSFTDLGYTQTLDVDGNYKSGGKIVTIKNSSSDDAFISTTSISQFDCDDIDSPMTLKKTESVTLLITNIDGADTILII